MTPPTDPPTAPSPDYPEIVPAALPPGWVVLAPQADDAADLHALLGHHEAAARGSASTTRAVVDADLSATGRLTHRHLLLRDDAAVARAWATVHDRAAGRVLVSVVVDPGIAADTADQVAHALFEWTASASADLAFDRGLAVTQMDSGAFDGDPRQQRWLADAGFDHVRTWLQMSRSVTRADAPQTPAGPTDADPASPGRTTAPELDPAVVVRQVRQSADGGPEQADVITVHDVLEEAFTDHFNYHAETFDEFSLRLSKDPGHRWHHWWIAELVDDPEGAPRTAGVLVGTVSAGPGDSPDGSYVAYLGVLQSARGRGVARSLLSTIIADAAERGRDRVGLEVDADSPTGAVDLYTSTGFRTSYVTQSWHRDLPVATTPR